MKLAVAGVAVFVVACVLTPHGLLDTSLYSDVHTYNDDARKMLDGGIPYRDFFDEYPPLAQPIILAARSVLLFKLLLVACGVGTVVLLATVFRSWIAVVVFSVSPLLVGSIYLNAYDLWPAFLLTAALALFARQRPQVAFAVLGAGAAAKIYPAAVLPIALLFVARHERVRGFLVFAGVFVAAHLPFLALAPGGLRHSYTLQAKRGLELNSLGSAILLLTGHPRTESQPPGSLNLVGGAAHAVAIASTIAVVASVALAAWLYARGRLSFLVACAAAVTGFVAFDKVFSAQYVEWLAPLAPLAGVGAAVLTALVLGLTRLVFHYRSSIAADRDLWPLLARDGLCVVLYVSLLLHRSRI